MPGSIIIIPNRYDYGLGPWYLNSARPGPERGEEPCFRVNQALKSVGKNAIHE